MQIQKYTITTEAGLEVTFRAVELSEAPILKEWMSSSLLTETIARDFAISLKEEEDWIQKAYTEDRILMIGIEVEKRLIGSSTINLKSLETGSNIGIPEYRGKGIGTANHVFRTWYAFEQMDLRMLRSKVMMDEFDEKYKNYASFKALQKVGYIQTGVQRDAHFIDGRRITLAQLECYNPRYWAQYQIDDVQKSIGIAKKTIEKGYERIKRA